MKIFWSETLNDYVFVKKYQNEKHNYIGKIDVDGYVWDFSLPFSWQYIVRRSIFICEVSDDCSYL